LALAARVVIEPHQVELHQVFTYTQVAQAVVVAQMRVAHKMVRLAEQQMVLVAVVVMLHLLTHLVAAQVVLAELAYFLHHILQEVAVALEQTVQMVLDLSAAMVERELAIL
jgi:hypothetical protein